MEEKVHDTNKLRIFTGIIGAILIGLPEALWHFLYYNNQHLSFEIIAGYLSLIFMILMFFFKYLREVSIACAILAAGLLCASYHLGISAIVWALFLIAYALLSQNVKLRCVLAIVACGMYIGSGMGNIGINFSGMIGGNKQISGLMSYSSWLYTFFFIDYVPAICAIGALSSCAFQSDDTVTMNKPLKSNSKQAVAVLETLEKYAALKEQGILTNEEFEEKKQNLMSQL